MIESKITIRRACPEDSPLAASLLYQTMHGLADFVFGSDTRHSVLDTIAFLFENRAVNRLNHRFARILDLDGKTAGVLVSYPGSSVQSLDIKTGWCLLRWFNLPALARLARRVRLIPGVEALAGEYYISNLAVLPEYQGQGLGTRLLAWADEQAREQKITRCSLCVDLDNLGARRLYERTGYQVVQQQATLPGAELAGRGYLRMVRQLPAPAL